MNSNETNAIHETDESGEDFNPDHHVEHPTYEQLTECERQIVDALNRERANYDKTADLRERVEEKMQLIAENQGLAVTFEAEEAEHIGAFEETAMSYEDAWQSRFDPMAP